jgi:sulfite dehydrogenase
MPVWGAVALALCCDPAPCAGPDDNLALGRMLFTQGATQGGAPPCAVCHTLKDAGSTGEVGPVLDEIRPDARRVTRAVREGLGAMPPYRSILTEAQIQAVADYVAHAAPWALGQR